MPRGCDAEAEFGGFDRFQTEENGVAPSAEAVDEAEENGASQRRTSVFAFPPSTGSAPASPCAARFSGRCARARRLSRRLCRAGRFFLVITEEVAQRAARHGNEALVDNGELLHSIDAEIAEALAQLA